MLRRLALFTLATTCAALALPASAHRLLVVNDAPLGPDNALVVEDIAVSQVAYHTASPQAPELWLTFDAEEGEALYLQLGVPQIDRLTALRPSIALLAPGGDPNVDVPFDLPEGYGGVVLSTAAVTSPPVFDEPFTGTSSWTLLEFDLDLPASGQYYLVAYLPGGGDGKFWMAVGTTEEFGIGDIFSLGDTIAQVRAFHEVGPFGGILAWIVTVLFTIASGFATLFALS
jgi:hypothetical protein